MKMKRKIILSALVLIAALFVQNAGAKLTSSYYDGSVFYDKVWEDGFLRGRIDFAVYNDRGEYEFRTGLSAPGSGTYVYAYQIFNDLAASDKAVAYFSLLGLSESIASGIGTGDDGTGGKKPAEWNYTASDGYWKWKIEGTNSLIYQDDHSWLLVFSSDNIPVKGNYDIKGTENDEIKQPQIPEPASMLVLLGAGGLMMRKRRSIPPSV